MVGFDLNVAQEQLTQAEAMIKVGEAHKKFRESEGYDLIIAQKFLVELPEEIGVNVAKNTGAFDTDRMLDMLKGINAFVQFEHKLAHEYNVAVQDKIDLEEAIRQYGSEE